ncbi:MAG: translesion error-prone DNA polymerase V autoproteolytic subunit [Victivallales bacterium]|nr:translesion error-prone DNA polymerase V autoproteolytic subunit [Victivallales bacterium]
MNSSPATFLSPPVFEESVPAGFPSPAEGYAERPLDLNELLVKNPPATFFVRVSGDSMTGAGVFPGDLMVVDRSLRAVDGSVVVALLEGEFTLKRLRLSGDLVELLPENEAYPVIKVEKQSDFQIWGVATHCVHSLGKS